VSNFQDVYAFFMSSKLSAPLSTPRRDDGIAMNKASAAEAAVARAVEAAKAPLADEHCAYCNAANPRGKGWNFVGPQRLCGACERGRSRDLLSPEARPGGCLGPEGGCKGCTTPATYVKKVVPTKKRKQGVLTTVKSRKKPKSQ
jgi:hypothetical protein